MTPPLTTSNANHTAALYALLSAMILLLAGNGLLETSVSYRSALLSQSAAITSWIMACYYLGFLAGSWHMPMLLRILSHRAAFTLLAPRLAALIFCLSLYHAPKTVALLQLGCGLCISGLYVVAESYINSRCHNTIRTRFFSYYMLTWYLGIGFGQLPLLSDTGFNSYLFNIAALLVLLSLVPLPLMSKQSPPTLNQYDESKITEKTRYRQLLLRYPFAFCVSAISGVMIGIFFGMGPAFGEQHLSSSQQTALMIAAFVLGAGMMQMPLAKLCNAYHPIALVMAMAFMGAMSALLAAVYCTELTFMWILLASLTLGICALPLYTVATTLIQNQVTDYSRITASALILLCNGLGSIAGPLLAGSMMTILGSEGFYISFLFCCLLLLITSLWIWFSNSSIILFKQHSL